MVLDSSEIVKQLETQAPIELGLEAEATSRRLLAGRAGWREPRHAWLEATTDLHASYIRLLGSAPGLDLDQACRAVERMAARGAWVEGLLTHDLAALGQDAPARLRGAGLQRVGGSHAELFEAGERHWRGQHDWSDSLAWLERAASAGLRLQPALFYGEDETAEQLASRLLDVRRLQERTGQVDGLSLVPHHARKAVETPGEISFGLDDMRLLATARLVLDNIRHVEVPWLAMGFKAGTMALAFGADDLGPWCLDRSVTEGARLATYLAVREEEIG
ncbi:MAG TPA: hypothetical protein VGO93_14875, partial [Candidatus Xenobia bacterium]